MLRLSVDLHFDRLIRACSRSVMKSTRFASLNSDEQRQQFTQLWQFALRMQLPSMTDVLLDHIATALLNKIRSPQGIYMPAFHDTRYYYLIEMGLWDELREEELFDRLLRVLCEGRKPRSQWSNDELWRFDDEEDSPTDESV